MSYLRHTVLTISSLGLILVNNVVLAGIEVYPFDNPNNYTESNPSLTDIDQGITGQGLGRLAVIHSPNDIPGDIHPSADAAIGDFNNDGRLDIYSACNNNNCDKLYLGNGAGSFTVNNISSPIYQGHFRVSASDFDNDGNLDVYISTAGSANAQNVLHLGSGTGSFIPSNIPGDMSNAYGSTVGDFDNDGNDDLYVTNNVASNSVGQNNLYLGVGGGAFSSANIPGDIGGSTASVAADFNSDGNLDIYVNNNGSLTNSYNKIYFGDGTGAFPSSINHGILAMSLGVSSGDFNNDNNSDLYITHPGGPNELYLGDGSGGFMLNNAFSNLAQSFDVSANDFNDDGNLDLYVANSGQNKMYLGDGNGSFTSNDIIGDLETSYGVNTGDVNSDGIADIYISNIVNGVQNRLFLSGYSTLAPSIQANMPFEFMTPLTDFIEVLSPNNEGKVVYQFSLDYGITWKYYDGTAWSDTVQTDGTEANLAVDLNSSVLANLAPNGSLIWRAYLLSDGTQKVEIDEIIVANRQL